MEWNRLFKSSVTKREGCNVGKGPAAAPDGRGQVFVLDCTRVWTQVAEHSLLGVERNSE